jgi:hypothetical protein
MAKDQQNPRRSVPFKERVYVHISARLRNVFPKYLGEWINFEDGAGVTTGSDAAAIGSCNQYWIIRSRWQPARQARMSSADALGPPETLLRQSLMQTRTSSVHARPLVWACEIHRLLQALSPSGHFARHTPSPVRSASVNVAC